jgi:hypothetical protein
MQKEQKITVKQRKEQIASAAAVLQWMNDESMVHLICDGSTWLSLLSQEQRKSIVSGTHTIEFGLVKSKSTPKKTTIDTHDLLSWASTIKAEVTLLPQPRTIDDVMSHLQQNCKESKRHWAAIAECYMVSYKSNITMKQFRELLHDHFRRLERLDVGF